MSKQRLLDALTGKKTDMPAWLPYVGVHAAHLLGESAENYLKNPALHARGVANAAKVYRADGIPLLFDLSVEAHALGCELKWWADNVPSVINHPLSSQTLEEAGLKMFDRNSGRWPQIFEAAALIKPRLEAMDCAMVGLACGPLTIASHLAGVRIFTDCYKNPERAAAVCKFAGEACLQAVKFYLDMGCDVVALVDPVASQIKAATFRQFVTPNTQSSWEEIRKAGKVSSYFICGDCLKVLDEVCDIGAQSIAIDEQLNLNNVREKAMARGIGFCGNLKLTLSLSLGIIPPKEDALISLAAGGRTGYVLAPGCDMPFDVPQRHLEAVVEARDWYAENYPPYPA